MAETVGEQLKRAREERKMTLEQVFQATRINPRYLDALESNLHDSGPSPVQMKGFLRLYAGYLDLSVQPLLDAWEGKLSSELPLPPEEDSTESTIQPEEPSAPEEEAVPIEVQYIGPEEVDQETASTSEPEETLAESQQIFVEIGAQLKERREMLGLTQVDVERFTKLRQHYLHALETGQMRDLPSMVQGRGMLSNYAGFLELDVEALLLRFADALQQRRLESMPPPQPPTLLERAKQSRQTSKAKATAKAGWRRLITADLLIGGVVVIALTGFAIWGAAQVTAMRAEAAQSTVLPIANVLIETGTPAPEVTSTPTLPPVPAQVDAAENPVQVDANTGEVTPTGIPAIGDAPLQVYVVARQRAWLRVSEDGKVKFNARIVPGNAYPFSGEKSIELTSGNAAALQIFFNNQDLGSLGVTGQTVALIFNETGVVKPTPAFTPTVTRSPVPSVTSQPTATLASPTVTPYIP